MSLFFPPQHFVSERKYDEDLGKAVRFTFDLEPLKSSITGFGSGRPPLVKRPRFCLFSCLSHMTCQPLLWFTCCLFSSLPSAYRILESVPL